MPKKILQQPDPVLRQIAQEIPPRTIKTAKIKKILDEMSKALSGEEDGVAIAAPQIGYSLRIFLVSGKVFVKAENIKNRKSANMPRDKVYINPIITKLSREKEWVPEGCLSVRWLYGKTNRAKKAFISAYDESGTKFLEGASGLLAQIFQHETDHLNGTLFIDHAKEIKEELPPKTKK